MMELSLHRLKSIKIFRTDDHHGWVKVLIETEAGPLELVMHGYHTDGLLNAQQIEAQLKGAA